MERTIKNFNRFIASIWEEFAINFLNSISPNPFEVLQNIDDISLEYEDLGYSTYSYLRLIDTKDGDNYDLLFSELSSKKTGEKQIKISSYYPGLRVNSDLVKCIESGDYQIAYSISINPKYDGQRFFEMLEECYYPIMERLGNEYNINQLSFSLSFNNSRGFVKYDKPFPDRGKYQSEWTNQKFSLFLDTIEIK